MYTNLVLGEFVLKIQKAESCFRNKKNCESSGHSEITHIIIHKLLHLNHPINLSPLFAHRSFQQILHLINGRRVKLLVLLQATAIVMYKSLVSATHMEFVVNLCPMKEWRWRPRDQTAVYSWTSCSVYSESLLYMWYTVDLTKIIIALIHVYLLYTIIHMTFN